MRLTIMHKLTATTGAALIVIGILVWAMLFLASKIDGMQSHITQTKTAISSLENQRRHMSSLTRIVEERQRDFERINSYFVDSDRPITFIETLEDLARRTENSITLDTGTSIGREETLAFNIMIEGTQESTLRYIKLVELLPYELTIENFNIVLQPAREGTNAKLNAAIRVAPQQ
jgi:hypothetical protein